MALLVNELLKDPLKDPHLIHSANFTCKRAINPLYSLIFPTIFYNYQPKRQHFVFQDYKVPHEIIMPLILRPTIVEDTDQLIDIYLSAFGKDATSLLIFHPPPSTQENSSMPQYSLKLTIHTQTSSVLLAYP